MSGSSEQKQQINQQVSPWGPQAGALTNAFSNAQDAYAKASQAQAPNDFVAQFTPDQLATFKQMLGYTGSNTLPGQVDANASNNLGVGSSAYQGALTGYNNFDPSVNLSNPNVLSTAQAYMSGENIPAQVKAAMQSATEQARDVTLPGIDQAASASNNSDSSRAGIASGIVQRGLAEQNANLTGALTSQAWDNAIKSAISTGGANNAATLQKLQQLGVLGYTGSATGGTNASGSINDQGNLYSMAQNAGQGEQAAAQAALDNQLQRYKSQVSSPYDALNGEMGIIGSANWGSNTTGTTNTTSTPSAWQVIGGLLGGVANGASMAGGLGWKPFGSSPASG